MKQKLKIPIGSSLQKAATCLTFAAASAALGFTSSCSSDNEYEEPWLNKEHKTRAGSDIYYIESQGEVHYTLGNQRLSVNATLFWESGEVGYPWPQLTVRNCDYTRFDTTVTDIQPRFAWIGSNANPKISAHIPYSYYIITDTLQPDGTYRKKKGDAINEILDVPAGTVVKGPGPEIHLSALDSCSIK